MTFETSRPFVETGCGPIVGRRSGQVNVFKGVPFARPPMGALRFRPPEPMARWSEPLDAAEFGASPLQPTVPLISLPGGTSEDCLTLNIWAPADGTGPHPVMFSVYGGGNYIGSSSTTDGARYAEQGLVFVSSNYRLGALGAMELGAVDPAFAGSGLNGLRDIIAALTWVRDNITAFGGDPRAVTVIGISAGGKNQCALAAMPSARGLFKRMTILSGGGHTVFRSAEEAAPVARGVLAGLGLGPTDVEGLIAAPAEAVLEAQTKAVASFPRGFPFRPTVDGELLPLRPIEAAQKGLTADLDIIVGTIRDEGALALPPAVAEKPFVSSQLGNLDLASAQALERKYEAILPTLSAADRRIRLLTAEEYWIPSVRFAEAHARAGGRVWMYRFDWASVTGPYAGYAPHGSESPFVYGGPGLAGLALPDDSKPAALRCHAMWAGWARTGQVRLEGAPDWPLYDEDRRLTLILDRENHIEADPRGDERRLWDGVL
jgi:para-nitrobenzyl esterase